MTRVFHKSLNVAVTGPAMRCGRVSLQSREEDGFRSALITPIGQARQSLPCSGSGEPELQRWAQCLFEMRR